MFLSLPSLSALLIAAVVGLGLMIVLMVAVCILLTSMKCRRKRMKRIYESVGRWSEIRRVKSV